MINIEIDENNTFNKLHFKNNNFVLQIGKYKFLAKITR